MPNTIPDYVYDTSCWEMTYPWEDRGELVPEIQEGEILKVGCLKRMHPRFALRWNGEVIWFTTESKAKGFIAEHGKVYGKWKVEGRTGKDERGYLWTISCTDCGVTKALPTSVLRRAGKQFTGNGSFCSTCEQRVKR